MPKNTPNPIQAIEFNIESLQRRVGESQSNKSKPSLGKLEPELRTTSLIFFKLCFATKSTEG
jgi:hypothetical protein